jgi:hypothetical protein
MNGTTKLILGIVVGVTLLCVAASAGGLLLLRSAGWALGRAIETDAETVAEISGSIADYDLPAGFEEAYATRLAGFSLVSYTGHDEHSHIYLFQLPSYVEIDQAEIERQLQQATGKEGTDWAQTEVVDRQPATICGEATTLVVSEGVNHDKQPFRQVSGMFTGKGGQALVVFETPVSSWDQAVVDGFIASIH